MKPPGRYLVFAITLFAAGLLVACNPITKQGAQAGPQPTETEMVFGSSDTFQLTGCDDSGVCTDDYGFQYTCNSSGLCTDEVGFTYQCDANLQCSEVASTDESLAVVTEAPAATDEPAATEAATEAAPTKTEPVVTEAPAATEETPVATEAPATETEPAATEAPTVADTPTATETQPPTPTETTAPEPQPTATPEPPPTATPEPPPTATATSEPPPTATPLPTATAVPAPANGMTAAQVNEMVAAHNRWRAEVGTPNLKWSDSLAAGAQDWADKLAADGGNLVHSDGDWGENLFGGSGKAWGPTDAVDSWGSEKQFYNGEAIDNQNFRKFGHYTQMVWGKTTDVGCGVATSQSGNIVWVCRYSPAGNMIGEKPF